MTTTRNIIMNRLWNIIGDPERFFEEQDAWIFIDYHTHKGSAMDESRGIRKFHGSATMPLCDDDTSLKSSWSFRKKRATDGCCNYINRTFNRTSKINKVNRVTQAITRNKSPKEQDEDSIWAYRGFS